MLGRQYRLFGLFALMGLLFSHVAWSDPTVRVGVLAWQGLEEAEIRWASLGQQLQKRLPQKRIVLRHLDLEGMSHALHAHELDFVITNPGHYVTLESNYGITRIATQIAGRSSNPEHVVGSAVVLLSSRTEIQALADLRGRTLAAVSPDAFGGYQLIWAELKNLKLDPEQGDLNHLFTGFPMSRVVEAVLQGKADAGVLRACMLEQLETRGEVPKGLLRVISPRNEMTDCRVTSKLYPGWAFAAAGQTPPTLSRDILLALLSLSPDDSGASWTVPADYSPVHELLRGLQIGPYAFLRESGWQSFWVRYWPWLAGLAILLLIWGVYTVHVEHLVQRRTRELTTAMAERRAMEDRIQTSQHQMDHLSRLSILGELSGTLAHELNQPLAAIGNYARSLLRRQASGTLSPAALRQATEEIANESERAAGILGGIRAFSRKRNRVREVRDIAELVMETANMLANMQARAPAVELHSTLEKTDRQVLVDPLQVQQVLLNLFKNALDAQQSIDVQAPIEVSLTQEDARCCITICDHGPGLSADLQTRLFEAFFTTKPDGLGLGLSICKTIVEAHGGTLNAMSADPGPGLCFQFTLPLAFK